MGNTALNQKGGKVKESKGTSPRINFRIPLKFLEKLEAIAKKEGVTKSVVVRNIIIRFLKRGGNQK